MELSKQVVQPVVARQCDTQLKRFHTCLNLDKGIRQDHVSSMTAIHIDLDLICGEIEDELGTGTGQRPGRILTR